LTFSTDENDMAFLLKELLKKGLSSMLKYGKR
jgi:hypothetical protein